MSNLDSTIRIDVTGPEHLIVGPTTDPDDDVAYVHHRLDVSNGREWHGLSWRNNIGWPDRDRFADNVDDCHRVALFGASWVALHCSRTGQKPGLIAEVLLDARHRRCHEVFTMGRPLMTVENHAPSVATMVEGFGVHHLVFSISDRELCRMDDLSYATRNAVSAQTLPFTGVGSTARSCRR